MTTTTPKAPRLDLIDRTPLPAEFALGDRASSLSTTRKRKVRDSTRKQTIETYQRSAKKKSRQSTSPSLLGKKRRVQFRIDSVSLRHSTGSALRTRNNMEPLSPPHSKSPHNDQAPTFTAPTPFRDLGLSPTLLYDQEVASKMEPSSLFPKNVDPTKTCQNEPTNTLKDQENVVNNRADPMPRANSKGVLQERHENSNTKTPLKARTVARTPLVSNTVQTRLSLDEHPLTLLNMATTSPEQEIVFTRDNEKFDEPKMEQNQNQEEADHDDEDDDDCSLRTRHLLELASLVGGSTGMLSPPSTLSQDEGEFVFGTQEGEEQETGQSLEGVCDSFIAPSDSKFVKVPSLAIVAMLLSITSIVVGISSFPTQTESVSILRDHHVVQVDNIANDKVAEVAATFEQPESFDHTILPTDLHSGMITNSHTGNNHIWKPFSSPSQSQETSTSETSFTCFSTDSVCKDVPYFLNAISPEGQHENLVEKEENASDILWMSRITTSLCHVFPTLLLETLDSGEQLLISHPFGIVSDKKRQYSQTSAVKNLILNECSFQKSTWAPFSRRRTSPLCSNVISQSAPINLPSDREWKVKSLSFLHNNEIFSSPESYAQHLHRATQIVSFPVVFNSQDYIMERIVYKMGLFLGKTRARLLNQLRECDASLEGRLFQTTTEINSFLTRAHTSFKTNIELVESVVQQVEFAIRETLWELEHITVEKYETMKPFLAKVRQELVASAVEIKELYVETRHAITQATLAYKTETEIGEVQTQKIWQQHLSPALQQAWSKTEFFLLLCVAQAESFRRQTTIEIKDIYTKTQIKMEEDIVPFVRLKALRMANTMREQVLPSIQKNTLLIMALLKVQMSRTGEWIDSALQNHILPEIQRRHAALISTWVNVYWPVVAASLNRQVLSQSSSVNFDQVALWANV